MQLEFASIMDATNNFSDANKPGEGGFGPVYKVNITVCHIKMKISSTQCGIPHRLVALTNIHQL